MTLNLNYFDKYREGNRPYKKLTIGVLASYGQG